MAIFNFETGNDNIEGKIEYSCTRTQEDFIIFYAVYMRRKNNYSGVPSNGTINYTFYINDSYKNTGSKSEYEVPNDKSWSEIVSGTKEYALDTFVASSFKVGFESTAGSNSSSAFNVAKQMSSSIFVPAYATRPQPSGLNIVYNAGDNYYTFVGTIGNNGINNKTTGCRVFYTINGTVPNSNSPSFTITGKEKTTWIKQINIPIVQGTQTIRARISTLAPLGDVDTPEENTLTWNVAYYSPPYPLQNLSITYSTPRPTPSATYKFKWYLRKEECGGYNNFVGSYLIGIYVNDVLKKTITVEENNTKIEGQKRILELTGEELGLQKGDILNFSGIAIGKGQYNNTSEKVFSLPITILSIGTAKIKTSSNWEKGQVWLKTKEKWVRSTSIYVKTSDEWKQSL